MKNLYLIFFTWLSLLSKIYAQYPSGVDKFTIQALKHSSTYKNSSDFYDGQTMHARLFDLKTLNNRTLRNTEDAIFYLLKGAASLSINGHAIDVGAGDILYIRKDIPYALVRPSAKTLVIGIYSKADRSDTVSFKKWSMNEISGKRVKGVNTWNAFIRSASLTMGLYMLPKSIGGDSTLTHKVDELNIVTGGAAVFSVDGKPIPVKKGDIIFVQKGLGHYFHDLQEDFDVLIFWEKKSVQND